MTLPFRFKCDCGQKWKIPFKSMVEEIACECGSTWAYVPGELKRTDKKEVIQLNIKEKLIEQLSTLERIQSKAENKGELVLAADISRTIMDYIRCIDVTADDDEEDDSICEDCLERELHEQMVDDIAKASDLPPQLVQRVLDGQAEVLGMDD